MAKEISLTVEYELMRAVSKLGMCLVALDDANQSLRQPLPECSNRITIDAVYYGVREEISDIRDNLEAIWKTM